VTLANIEPVVPRDEGVWATSRAMLAKSFHGLSVSLTALVVGALFVAEAHRMYARIRSGRPVAPMRLFHWSTTYLTVVFVAIAVDALLRT